MGPMTLPPGFRFHPTDEELVAYYLDRKINGGTIELQVIPEVDLYKCEPWDLPEKSVLPSKDMEWYFYSPRDRKYPNGSRTNRATRSGYWKATGKDRTVKSKKKDVGMKKTLVYYRGRAPHGIRSHWVMHEYRLLHSQISASSTLKDSYALCRVFKKKEIADAGSKSSRKEANQSEAGVVVVMDDDHQQQQQLVLWGEDDDDNDNDNDIDDVTPETSSSVVLDDRNTNLITHHHPINIINSSSSSDHPHHQLNTSIHDQFHPSNFISQTTMTTTTTTTMGELFDDEFEESRWFAGMDDYIIENALFPQIQIQIPGTTTLMDTIQHLPTEYDSFRASLDDIYALCDTTHHHSN